MAKNSIKIIEFYDSLYYINYIFLVGNYDDVNKYVDKEFDIDLSLENTDCGGFHIDTETNHIFIFFQDQKDEVNKIGDIAHETFHATKDLFELRGIKLSEDSEEAYAYYQSFLIRTFLTLFNKKYPTK